MGLTGSTWTTPVHRVDCSPGAILYGMVTHLIPCDVGMTPASTDKPDLGN